MREVWRYIVWLAFIAFEVLQNLLTRAGADTKQNFFEKFYFIFP